MKKTQINMEDKEWYKSKTIIIGLITLILGVLEAIQGDLNSGVPVTLMSVLMIALRLITSGKVKILD